MTRTRIIITAMLVMLAAASLWAKDDEVIVTRQLTAGQRNALPEKTVTVEMKRVAPNKKADAGLTDAIQQVMDTIASEDYQHRTFVMLLRPQGNGSIDIAVSSDDIVTRGKQDASIYYGTLEHKRYHFVLLTSNENAALLEQTFKRQGKVKFVQEFEFVDFPTPLYPTSVICRWTPDKGLSWKTVYINGESDDDRSRNDVPAQFQD